MSASPIEVVGQWMQNLLNPDTINRVVAPDATYVSLNTEDPELSKIMPWTGTSRGPQAVLVTYLQYLEDSYATAASFRPGGSWTVQTEPGTEPFQV